MTFDEGDVADKADDGLFAWERQPWESATAYARFEILYLGQEEPRSVNAAWRAWKKGKTGVQPPLSKKAVRRWRYWSQGQTWRGEAIPGALTWRQRADAYNAHLSKLTLDIREYRRRKTVEADFAVGEELRALAAKILKEGPKFVKTTRRFVKGQTETIVGKDKKEHVVQLEPDKEVVFMALDARLLISLLETASKIQRQAVELAPPAQGVRLLDKEGDDLLSFNTIVLALQRADEALGGLGDE